jgi:hypothetical protein
MLKYETMWSRKRPQPISQSTWGILMMLVAAASAET